MIIRSVYLLNIKKNDVIYTKIVYYRLCLILSIVHYDNKQNKNSVLLYTSRYLLFLLSYLYLFITYLCFINNSSITYIHTYLHFIVITVTLMYRTS